MEVSREVATDFFQARRSAVRGGVIICGPGGWLLVVVVLVCLVDVQYQIVVIMDSELGL